MEVTMGQVPSGAYEVDPAAASINNTMAKSKASLISKSIPSLLAVDTNLKFISEDPEPFPSGCAQPSSTFHKRPHSIAQSQESSTALAPAFLGSLYTMGDRARRHIIALGRVQELPPGAPLPGLLGMLNDTPVGKAVERGLLWWVNRGRVKPHFEFFLSKETAGKHINSAKGGWLVSPEVSSSVVVECPLQEAYNCTKIDSDAFKLVPDERQVRAAKRIIKWREGRRAAKSFRGTPIFAAQNFHIVVPTPEGVRWYHPCFLDKSQLHLALDRSVDLHFEGLIRTRRAQRYSPLDQGGSHHGGLGGPPSDTDGLDEDSGLLDPSDMKDLMEEAPTGTSVGVDKILFSLAALYVQDLFDDIFLGNKWMRHAVGLQPRFTITADSFEDCAAAAEASAIAKARLQQQMAKGFKVSGHQQEATTGFKGSGREQDSDRQLGSGAPSRRPPVSSLLGDVVREVEAKRELEERGRTLDEGREDKKGVTEGREQRGRLSSRGDRPGDEGVAPVEAAEVDLRKRSNEGELSNGWEENGEETGKRDCSTSGGSPEKQWWEIIMEHPAFKREPGEASSGRTKRGGVVVNRGPGWAIVRRGPFWNRQYELEQVPEEQSAGGSNGQAKASDGQAKTFQGKAEILEKQAELWKGQPRSFGGGEGSPEITRGSEGAPEQANGGAMRDRSENEVAEIRSDTSRPASPSPDTETASETGTAQAGNGSNDRRHGERSSERKDVKRAGASEKASKVLKGRKLPFWPSRGASSRGGSVEPAGSGRYIDQREWDAIKASVEAKLKRGSVEAGAESRQQRWEAIKASIEAKLAAKYREEGVDLRKAGGEGSSPVDDGFSQRRSEVSDNGSDQARGASSSGKGGPHRKNGDSRIYRSGRLPSKTDALKESQKGELSKSKRAGDDGKGQLGVAGVVRDEARMALIAVASGSPQEKDLQGALDAVSRDISLKTDSDLTMMFIANTDKLFGLVGQQAAVPSDWL